MTGSYTSAIPIVAVTESRIPADYAEERRSELEVLEAIFPDELTDDKLSIRVEPEVPNPNDPCSSLPSLLRSMLLSSNKSNAIDTLMLHITYSPTYPDELPEIDVETIEGNLDEEEEEQLVMGLIGTAKDSLGMAMVYTLSLYLRESLAALIDERKARIAREDAEKTRIAEEAVAIRTAGTKVTPESFAAWKLKFEKEMAEQAKKELNETLSKLPPKEREERKRWFGKLTGRQLFEKDQSLLNSDAAFLEEGTVDVDASQYERTEGLSDDEDEEKDGKEGTRASRLGELSDSD